MKKEIKKRAFNAWKSIEVDLSQLKGIVQNDIPISPEQIHEWGKIVFNVIGKIESLSVSTQIVVHNNKKHADFALQSKQMKG